MQDAENLTKLLGHLEPAKFHKFLADQCGLSIPAPNPDVGKRAQREQMQTALSACGVSDRQRAEEVAERIVLMADGAGQDVITGFAGDIFDERDSAGFSALRNQYERSLWMYCSEPELFKLALDARQADLYRQSATCFSGYLAEPDLVVKTDDAARDHFHGLVADALGCSRESVAVQVFKRLRPDTETGEDVDLYQISVHYNRPPETVDRVQASEVVPLEIVRAESAHITYEPSQGFLEVLSKGSEMREILARLAADALMASPITGEKVPIKQYDYQSLRGPRVFDTTGEASVEFVKVAELGYAGGKNRSVIVKIWTTDPQDIYTAARSLIGPGFDFRNHRLNYARLSVRLRKSPGERARTITIILRDDNRCNIKTKRERDRALCDRLLAKWNLIRVIGSGPSLVAAA